AEAFDPIPDSVKPLPQDESAPQPSGKANKPGSSKLFDNLVGLTGFYGHGYKVESPISEPPEAPVAEEAVAEAPVEPEQPIVEQPEEIEEPVAEEASEAIEEQEPVSVEEPTEEPVSVEEAVELADEPPAAEQPEEPEQPQEPAPVAL